ncbi:LOW QUALITY PROTEIN: uncharacterized protein [Amphiura filiformis]|uniref:LOW QUALITY PROTEIN: uncharacterized protein n=1 Tax=Amphiura filiformis TaxID=82378 RepID=UPI003B21BC46
MAEKSTDIAMPEFEDNDSPKDSPAGAGVLKSQNAGRVNRGRPHLHQQKGNPNDVVIKNIARFVGESELAKLIIESDCKGFVNVVIIEDEAASSKRSAVVTFESTASAIEATTKLFGKRLKGFTLNASLAQEQAGISSLIAKKKIQALLNKIESEGNKVVVELDARMSELAFQVKELEEKLEDCDSIKDAIQLDQQKNAVKQQIKEVQGYQAEFQQVSVMTKSQLDRMQPLTADNVNLTELDNLSQRFLRECRRTQRPLPIYGYKAFILETITASDTNACVIRAETGSGKSTQVPQYLIEDTNFLTSPDGSKKTVICTQPRRVAAISLARRVAEEYGCKVGEEIGYVAGQSRKVSSRTLAKFMTDRALLNICLADKSDLADCACVIIDEAHERSVDTDILLAMLKKMQHRRPDLKVVIMSATIDVDLFSKYLYNCPVVDVPGRTFPVDTIWCGLAEGKDAVDYINRAVEKAEQIHHQEDTGDILVFLTSQNEIERACNHIARSLKSEDVIILPLHGKLQPDDQMKVFKDTPEGKRKIVFATNVAETSVTIPGIKYVVDSGMVKECQYDPQRNMSLLKVTGITQASADQRKGRAGRTGPGVCYRLYNKSDFDEMDQSMKPEILRVHLGMAMLQLIQMGVQDVEKFDFVESPEKVLSNKMISLVLLGAVDDEKRQLTPLGEKMAQLPLEPRLAKLVLTGIGNNVGDEAVALAALVSAPGNIIFRGSSEADQRNSEMMKLKYSSEGGDILTMLKIYKTWSTVPEKGRNVWCKRNSMNAKTLRTVKENVDEIKQILKRSLKIEIEKTEVPDTDDDDENGSTFLRKILMSVYFENLSVYNGHPKAGYTIVGQQKTAVVHPSSVLKSMKSQPKWLIYGDLRRTSQDFLCDLTPVEAEWIDEVVPQLFKDKIDREALERNIIKEVKITNVGTALMKTLAMKRFERLRGLEDRITTESNTPCIIESDWEAGSLNVFIASHGEVCARERIAEYLKDERIRARREQKEVPVGSSGNVRHVVVTGGETGFVLMGDEYRSLDISSIPKGLGEEEVLQLCGCRPDQVKEVFKFPSHWSQAKKGVWGRVTFLDPSDAIQVKNKLDGRVYPGEEEPISAQPSLPKQNTFDPRRKTAIETTVEVTWFLGRSRGFGFVTCQTTGDSARLMDDIQGLPLRGRPIKCDFKKEDTRVVYISRLDFHVTQEELENALKRATRVSFNSVSIVRNKPTTIMKNSTAKRHLRPLFNVDGIGQLDINVLEPKSEKSQRRIAFVNFDPSFHQQMSEKVKGLQTAPTYTENQEMYHVRMRVTSYLFCTVHIYRLMKDQIDDFIDVVEGSGEDITVKIMQMRNRADGWRLQIAGTDYQKVYDVRTALKTLLHGEEVPIEDFVGADKSSQWMERALQNLSGGRLEEVLGDAKSSFIDIDRRRRVIHIYGKEEGREEFKMLLQGYFLSLTDTQPIKMQFIKGAILRALVLKFGPWLEQLKEEPGVEDVTIDSKRGLMMLTVSEGSRETTLEKIQECLKDVNKVKDASEEIECGICFCPAEPDEKTYRLLSCGHYFCLKCLQNLLQHNMTDKIFPVVCPYEGCTEPLTLVDIRTIIHDEEAQIKLFRAALEAFVLQKKEAVLKFCPSPDCSMIYRRSESVVAWTCTECGHPICSGCGEDPHPGNMTCQEYKVSKESSDSIWQWARTAGANVKQCPTPDCGFIEKFEGCNRVSCIKCKKHICWNCLDSFDTSNQCYAHLTEKHGGCFDYNLG